MSHPVPPDRDLCDPSDRDQHFMRLALDLAERGRGAVEPNPMVGCAIVRSGQIVGQGFHARFGGPHAEIEALRSLTSLDEARGATVYVTLEPCCHHGKTPPCSEALLQAEVGRVVIAMEDPFAKVQGGGIDQLRKSQVDTVVGVLSEEAERLNAPYLKRVRQGKPWVIAKWAMTIDGRIATVAGDSRWITGPRARRQVHRLRERVDGVAVGMGTVEADDPMLNARLVGGDPPTRIASRVVFCRHRLPAVASKLVQSAAEIPLQLMVGNTIDESRLAPYRDRGADVTRFDTDDPRRMVELALDHLGRQGCTNLLVEGGGELLASFFEAGQIDECHVYIGAKAFGGRSASGPIGGQGVEKIGDSPAFRLLNCDRFEDDLRLIYGRLGP